MKKNNSVHFVGIKGVGMTALAVIVKEAGMEVTGSDVAEEFITDPILRKHKIKIYSTFSPENLKNCDLVITTGAHSGMSNPEVIEAQKRQVPVLSFGQAVGEMMSGSLIFKKKPIGISVSGTHGKTTTTGLIATVFSSCGLDPSYLIGTSEVSSLKDPGHFGKGKHFIVEADEYATDPMHSRKPKFLWQHPEVIVITNIDYDHPDIFSSLSEVKAAFASFITQLSGISLLVANGDDESVKDIIQKTKVKAVTYGFSPLNTYQITRVKIEGDHMFFSVTRDGMSLGNFFSKISGRHNAQNCLAAIVVGLELGLPLDGVQNGISRYSGSKRRMEYLGKLVSGADTYDDYAHHPREIEETLKALRSMNPGKRVVAIFQPHTYSRTKKMFGEFITSLKNADVVGIMDIFSSARENPDNSVSSEAMVSLMAREKSDVILLKKAQDVVEYLDKTHPDARHVVIFLGAGDIYKVKELLKFE